MKLEDVNINGVVLETDRLILRPFKEDDINDFYEYARVDGVGEAAGWVHHKDVEESKEILTHFIKEHRVFAITEKQSGKVIGSVGIERSGEIYERDFGDKNINEVGYVLSKDYWGKGLMTEAVKAVIRYLFDILNCDVVTVGHSVKNDRSRRVIEKCGFKFYSDGHYTAHWGEVFDEKCYVLTRERFEKLRGEVFQNEACRRM